MNTPKNIQKTARELVLSLHDELDRFRDWIDDLCDRITELEEKLQIAKENEGQK